MGEPRGIKGFICWFYDKNMYWLCRKRGLFMGLAFLMAVLVTCMGLQSDLLPGIGDMVYQQSKLARMFFILLAFCWVIDFRFYPLTIKSREVYSRQPDSYKVFSFFRLLLCIAILGIAIFQTWKMGTMLSSVGYSLEDMVKIFFTVDFDNF